MRAKVDILHMQDLEPRLAELPVGVGIGPGVLAALGEELPQIGVREHPPLGIREHVELDLTDAQLGKLFVERAVGIVEPLRPCLAGGADQLLNLRGGRDVV